MSRISPSPTRAQSGGKRQQPFLATQFRVHLARIDDVVTMHRARPGHRNGRGIDVAHPQRREPRHVTGRIGKGEAAMKLQAQRGARDHLRRASDGRGAARDSGIIEQPRRRRF